MLALTGGCSSSTPPTPAPSQVNYTQNAIYKYLDNTRNSSDMVDTTVANDTVTSTVIVANTSYKGMSNVTELINTHSNGSKQDTTYISQNNGEFWHYNYGLEAINNNASITNLIGGQVDIGWVLQANFNAVAGDKWVAANDSTLRLTVPVAGSIAATVVDTAVEKSDTSITINGSNVFSKHSLHTVTLTPTGFAPVVTTVDAYVASSAGVTLNILHTTNVKFPGLYSGPVKGNQSLLIKD